MTYLSAYTTPDAVIRQLDKANPNTSPSPEQSEYDDFYTLVSEYCYQASAYVSYETARVFVPYKETKDFYLIDIATSKRMSRNKMYLGDDLIVVSSVTFADTVLSATDYRLMLDNGEGFPYNAIRFNNSAGNVSWNGSEDSKISINATWGYHHSVSQMYTVVEAIGGSLTDSVTSITVADASRYEILQYIRIDSELLQVTARNTFTDVLTVTRGVNGTTAAAHSAYSIEKFNVTPQAAELTTRLVSWMYQHRNDVASRVQYADGSTSFEDLPPLFHRMMRTLTRFDGSAV